MKLEYILDQYSANLDPKVRQLLERGKQSTMRLTKVVQAMYDFAKLGSQAARMSEVPLKVLINEVVADMSFDESVDIKIGIAENLPTVWGNPELLRRAFINLIGNAVKYADKRDVIINVGVRSIENRTLAQFCQVYVQDNGAGIEPNELERIFTMFGRGDRFREATEGLGIGLSVVQRIMELHYGSVVVESVVGQGSTFVLSLPMEKISLSHDS
jgi:signal transduction histidine kinase